MVPVHAQLYEGVDSRESYLVVADMLDKNLVQGYAKTKALDNTQGLREEEILGSPMERTTQKLTLRCSLTKNTFPVTGALLL